MKNEDMPNYNDLPRAEALIRANRIVSENPKHLMVHFKYTCPHCGQRCTMAEPNVLYENGECCSCGKTSKITKAGFMLIFVSQEIPPVKAPLHGEN